jgi:hypothetical protein
VARRPSKGVFAPIALYHLAALPFRNDGVVLLLASQAGSYITGAEIVVDPSLLGTLF